jgi:hypothetical protein
MEFEWLVFGERHGHIGTHLVFPYYLYEPKHPSLDLSVPLPITNTAWVRAWLCKLQKGCTRLAMIAMIQLKYY